MALEELKKQLLSENKNIVANAVIEAARDENFLSLFEDDLFVEVLSKTNVWAFLLAYFPKEKLKEFLIKKASNICFQGLQEGFSQLEYKNIHFLNDDIIPLLKAAVQDEEKIVLILRKFSQNKCTLPNELASGLLGKLLSSKNDLVSCVELIYQKSSKDFESHLIENFPCKIFENHLFQLSSKNMQWMIGKFKGKLEIRQLKKILNEQILAINSKNNTPERYFQLLSMLKNNGQWELMLSSANMKSFMEESIQKLSVSRFDELNSFNIDYRINYCFRKWFMEESDFISENIKIEDKEFFSYIIRILQHAMLSCDRDVFEKAFSFVNKEKAANEFLVAHQSFLYNIFTLCYALKEACRELGDHYDYYKRIPAWSDVLKIIIKHCNSQDEPDVFNNCAWLASQVSRYAEKFPGTFSDLASLLKQKSRLSWSEFLDCCGVVGFFKKTFSTAQQTPQTLNNDAVLIQEVVDEKTPIKQDSLRSK